MSAGPSASTKSVPPLGELRGMTWDAEKKKYFPTKATTAPSAAYSRLRPKYRDRDALESLCEGGKDLLHGISCVDVKGKRRKIESVNTGGYRRRPMIQEAIDGDHRVMNHHYASLVHEETRKCCHCTGERITSFKGFFKDSYYATTDHGKISIRKPDGELDVIRICSEQIVGVHCDMARMTMMVIAGGSDSHVHHFKRDPDSFNVEAVHHSSLDLEQHDVFCMSSFDGICSLGCDKSIVQVHYNDGQPTISTRKLRSDPLSICQFDHDLSYVGLRNSSVILSDLRIPSYTSPQVCKLPAGKAVVGVKKVRDEAVPFGLAVSGLKDQLLLFDARFGQKPLHTLSGYINDYRTDLAMELSNDGKQLWAAGSDNRLGLWSTITGERIHPIHPIPSIDDHNPGSHDPSFINLNGSANDGEKGSLNGDNDPWTHVIATSGAEDTKDTQRDKVDTINNPLATTFPDRIRGLIIKEDGGLEVACGGSIMSYGTRERVKQRVKEEEEMIWD